MKMPSLTLFTDDWETVPIGLKDWILRRVCGFVHGGAIRRRVYWLGRSWEF